MASNDFPILFFGFHGEPGCLYVGNVSVSIEEIVKRVGRIKTKFGGWIHFSSCSTLNLEGEVLEELLICARVDGISGYDFDVLSSEAVFEDCRAILNAIDEIRV